MQIKVIFIRMVSHLDSLSNFTEAQGNSEMAYLITDIGFSHTFLIDITSFIIFLAAALLILIFTRPLCNWSLLRFPIDQFVMRKSHYL